MSRRYVALLRGVNLGPRNRIAMGALRDLCSGLGHIDVSTYIASGNALFTVSGAAGEAAVAAELEGAIERVLGVRTRVALRTPAELAGLVAGLGPHVAGLNPARVAVDFLFTAPDPAAVSRLSGELERFRFAARGRDVVLHAEDWPGEMGIAQAAVERALGPGTVRNWNTTRKLAALAAV